MRRIILFCVLVCLFINSELLSREFRVSQIPNGEKSKCLNCHFSLLGGSLNVFGQEILANHLTSQNQNGNVIWSPQLAALDSDNDGFTNGEELLDPNGSWKIGDNNPGNINDAGNPGNPNVVPTSIREIFQNHNAGLITIQKISPNPVSEKFQLTFDLKKDDYVSIALFDVSGKKVMEFENSFYYAAKHTILLNLNKNSTMSISQGTYILSVIAGNSYSYNVLKIQK